MKSTLSIIFLISLIAIAAFAQSNYEILLSRPDISGLTGGGATNLDGIPTTGLAIGTMVTVYDGSETRIYRLTTGTDAESSPAVIRPDDYVAGTNEKVWKVRISSDPSETGNADGHSLDADDGSPVDAVYVDADGEVGIGTTTPGQKLEVAGDINVSSGQGYRINNTAASGQYLRGDGTRFVSSAIQAGDLPGSFSGKVVYMNYSASTGPDPTAIRQFLSPTVTATVTSSQIIHVTANRAFGAGATAAGSLDLSIGYRLQGSTAIPTTEGSGVWNLTCPANNRYMFGLSAVVSGLSGTYEFGMCGDDDGNGNWTNNEWGYVSIIVVEN